MHKVKIVNKYNNISLLFILSLSLSLSLSFSLSLSTPLLIDYPKEKVYMREIASNEREFLYKIMIYLRMTWNSGGLTILPLKLMFSLVWFINWIAIMYVERNWALQIYYDSQCYLCKIISLMILRNIRVILLEYIGNFLLH